MDIREFDNQDYGRVVNIRTETIELDSAQAANKPLEREWAGNFIWLTNDSTGAVHLRFNDSQSDRIPASANAQWEGQDGAKITRVFLDWAAQAGKSITVAWGEGLRFSPSNDISNIGSILNPIGLTPNSIGDGTYIRESASSALFTLVTPAANVNGIRVDALCASSATNQWHSFMSKASAPSAYNDASARFLMFSSDETPPMHQAIALPLIIPAGMGLYERASAASTMRVSALWKLL